MIYDGYVYFNLGLTVERLEDRFGLSVALEVLEERIGVLAKGVVSRGASELVDGIAHRGRQSSPPMSRPACSDLGAAGRAARALRRGVPADNETLAASDRHYQRGRTRRQTAIAGSTALLSYFGRLVSDRRADSVADVLDRPTESAVEATLRWTSPIVTFVRLVTADKEIGGQRAPAGEKVVMWYPSGVRDQDVFERPDEVDINCEPNEQLAFGGWGEHFWLSAKLARLEMRCLFVHVLDRLSETELDGEVERLRSGFVGGITRPSISVGAA